MANRSTLRDCYDAAGNFVPSKDVEFTTQRDEILEGADVLFEEIGKKRPFSARCSRGYDPQESRESLWF